MFFSPIMADSLHVKNDSTSKFENIDQIVVGKIILKGNKRTKDKIILRELDFYSTDTLQVSELKEITESNKNKIFNTKLFIEVKIDFQKDSVQLQSNLYNVIITVRERWYIFPAPIFELADRNFNEWIKDRGADISRTQYGIRFTHENFRGRKEGLKVVLQGGFTQKYELFYTVPYINRNQTTGLKLSLSYSQNREVAYRTLDHKLEYVNNERDILRDRFYSGLKLNKRNKFYGNHDIELIYHRNTVHDTIAQLNPDYFFEGKTLQQYIRLFYRYKYDKRDITTYPLKGYMVSAEFEQLGLGVFKDLSLTRFYIRYMKFFELPYKFYTGHSIRTKLSLPRHQPYFNIQGQGLGYDNNAVRGYELNVIDGQYYIVNRNEFKKHIISYDLNIEKVLPFYQFNLIPNSWYIKLFTDFGYVIDAVENPLNTAFSDIGQPKLSDKLLIGYGAGIDLFSFYDVVFRMEYSFNNVRQHGFFMEFVAGI